MMMYLREKLNSLTGCCVACYLVTSSKITAHKSCPNLINFCFKCGAKHYSTQCQVTLNSHCFQCHLPSSVGDLILHENYQECKWKNIREAITILVAKGIIKVKGLPNTGQERRNYLWKTKTSVDEDLPNLIPNGYQIAYDLLKKKSTK